jgi:hypothetical protein
MSHVSPAIASLTYAPDSSPQSPHQLSSPRRAPPPLHQRRDQPCLHGFRRTSLPHATPSATPPPATANMERMQLRELNMYDSKCLVIIFILVTQIQVPMDTDLVLIIKTMV